MPDELVNTRETLLKATQQVSVLNAENVRLRAKLAELRKIDPDRILSIVNEITTQLKASEQRSESLAAALHEQNERSNLLAKLVADQEKMILEMRSQLDQARSKVFTALEEVDQAEVTEAEHNYNIESLRGTILELTSAVKTATDHIQHLEDPRSFDQGASRYIKQSTAADSRASQVSRREQIDQAALDIMADL